MARHNNPARPGQETSEFWVTATMLVIAALTAVAWAMSGTGVWAAALTGGSASLATIVYTIARTWLKWKTMTWWEEPDDPPRWEPKSSIRP